jgi:hypothetical protein
MRAVAASVRVIACGALARELVELLRQDAFAGVELECLPPELHDRPERIPGRVRERIRAAHDRGEQVLVGYADCGTGGLLDRVCEEEGVERLPGAHCYELFAGPELFAALQEREPGTFYVTDFLARHFDRLVVDGLGLRAHPELRSLYFGNYRRLVHLAQLDDPDLDARAREAAAVLGLRHERVATGTGPLRRVLATAVVGRAPAPVVAHS